MHRKSCSNCNWWGYKDDTTRSNKFLYGVKEKYHVNLLYKHCLIHDHDTAGKHYCPAHSDEVKK